jgi:hypothetical protein
LAKAYTTIGNAHIVLDAHDRPNRSGIRCRWAAPSQVIEASNWRMPDKRTLHLSRRAGRKDTPAKQSFIFYDTARD